MKQRGSAYYTVTLTLSTAFLPSLNHNKLWQFLSFQELFLCFLADRTSRIALIRGDFLDWKIPIRETSLQTLCEKMPTLGMTSSLATSIQKLIGAKYFIEGYETNYRPLNETATRDFLSPRYSDGHGTHTLSTAGG
eukprot:Gb_18666 [translate_table: standard]